MTFSIWKFTRPSDEDIQKRAFTNNPKGRFFCLAEEEYLKNKKKYHDILPFLKRVHCYSGTQPDRDETCTVQIAYSELAAVDDLEFLGCNTLLADFYCGFRTLLDIPENDLSIAPYGLYARFQDEYIDWRNLQTKVLNKLENGVGLRWWEGQDSSTTLEELNIPYTAEKIRGELNAERPYTCVTIHDAAQVLEDAKRHGKEYIRKRPGEIEAHGWYRMNSTMAYFGKQTDVYLQMNPEEEAMVCSRP